MRTTKCVLATIALLGAAVTAQAQAPNCQSVEFSQDALAKFPRLREACLDVVEKQGELLAVFKADLVKVQGNRVRLRPKLPDGTHADARTVQVNPDRRVLIDGKPYRVSDLALGQELTFYAKVDEPQVALASEDASQTVDFAPLETEPMRVAQADPEPEMPATASLLPLIGLSGGLLMGLGALLALFRRIRR